MRIIQKKIYAIIAVLLLIAAISIASTKPDEPYQPDLECTESYKTTFELKNI